jgi:inositol transport system permease protein
MSQPVHGRGGHKFGPSQRARANEWNILLALVAIILVLEFLSRLNGGGFLFNMTDNVSTLFNPQRLDINILHVSITGITGIFAMSVTQVIILGGVDLPSGSVVGAAARIAMNLAQTVLVNGNPNPGAVFGDGAMDPPVIVPIAVGVACGATAGRSNGLLIAYTRIALHRHARQDDPGAGRGALVVRGPVGVLPDRGLRQPCQRRSAEHADLRPSVLGRAEPRRGLRLSGRAVPGADDLHPLWQAQLCHRVQRSRRARMSGINVDRPKVLVHAMAGLLPAVAAVLLTSKNLTAQADMGVMHELDAIAMAVIGGVSLSGGRGSIARTAAFASRLVIMDEPKAALEVQETAQVETIIRGLKDRAIPMVLVSHNLRQVFDLVDRIIGLRRGRIVASLRRDEADGNDIISYITGVKGTGDGAFA